LIGHQPRTIFRGEAKALKRQFKVGNAH
jgi:hypothetical protein